MGSVSKSAFRQSYMFARIQAFHTSSWLAAQKHVSSTLALKFYK